MVFNKKRKTKIMNGFDTKVCRIRKYEWNKISSYERVDPIKFIHPSNVFLLRNQRSNENLLNPIKLNKYNNLIEITNNLIQQP